MSTRHPLLRYKFEFLILPNAVNQRLLTHFIDTGADATMLPTILLEQIEAEITYSGQMRGILGQATQVDLYYVTVEIAGITLRGIRAIGMSSGHDEPIIGRDVLNRLKILLDGPAGMLEVLDE